MVIENMNNIDIYADNIIAMHMYNDLACLKKKYIFANINLCIKKF